jgi:hypothetical protein
MMEIIKTFWPIAMAFGGFLVWLIRLESRSIDNTKEIKRLWHQRREDLEASRIAREDTNKLLAEIRNDIKNLIAKASQ